MAAEWNRLCRDGDLSIEEPHIDVIFRNQRRHRVTVEDDGDAYRLYAVVARQTVVASIPDLPIEAWIRNRAALLVGFRIDRQNRLIAESWVPKVGLRAEEFQFYVRTVAAESDHFEYALTGKDVE